jgi:hypothetical protein
MFAATVDAVIFLPVVFGAGGYAVHVVTSRRRRAGRSAEDGDEFQQWFSTPQVAWGFRVFGLVSEVARQRRSPGAAVRLTRAGGKVAVRAPRCGNCRS